MPGSTLKMAAVAAFACMSVMMSWARDPAQIDSAHSTASLNLLSSTNATSWNIAIVKVSGTARLNSSEPASTLFDLNFYPAGQGSLLLKPDGTFRNETGGDLSRYALMTFRSEQTVVTPEGKLEIKGQLTVTYVHREATIEWSNAYSGAEYGEPIARSYTGTATFVVEGEKPDRAGGSAGNASEIAALASINLRDFPELRSDWLNAVWPVVVEDKNCIMPQVRDNLRDYSGAICTGNPVGVTPISRPPERFGTDYPGPNAPTTPPSDTASIVVHLRMSPSGQEPNSRDSR